MCKLVPEEKGKKKGLALDLQALDLLFRTRSGREGLNLRPLESRSLKRRLQS